LGSKSGDLTFSQKNWKIGVKGGREEKEGVIGGAQREPACRKSWLLCTTERKDRVLRFLGLVGGGEGIGARGKGLGKKSAKVEKRKTKEQHLLFFEKKVTVTKTD